MKRSHQLIRYILSDILTAELSYTLFFIFRKLYIEPQKFGYQIPVEFDSNFVRGLIILPFFWLIIYYLSDYYRDVFRKSRLQELGQTFLSTLIGVTIVFFAIILDDTVHDYINYYQSYLAFLVAHFVPTYLARVTITSRTRRLITRGKLSFNTLIIGANLPAEELFFSMKAQGSATGNRFAGYVTVNGKNGISLEKYLPHLGHFENILPIIRQHKIDEVIIAIDPSEQEKINRILNHLHLADVRIRAIPSLTDLLSGKVRFTTLYDIPLLEITHSPMPTWQMNIKELFDIIISLIVLVVLSPVCLLIALLIKMTSPGPVFYSHERIGRYGKPFKIIKFRTMVPDAEKNGPELSSRNDPRITPIGRFLRRTRLDEIPNFINVLRGEMSLVGPRPERQYYIDQIVQRAPYYVHLHRVKPGITSLGQVKFGYAENVDQMIRRLQYDLLYVENMSLALDIKILLYTIGTILRQKGI